MFLCYTTRKTLIDNETSGYIDQPQAAGAAEKNILLLRCWWVRNLTVRTRIIQSVLLLGMFR